MFDHMLITRKHFEHYIRAFGRNPEKPNVEPLHMVSSNFESLCQAVLRDNSIDDYLELVKRPFPPPSRAMPPSLSESRFFLSQVYGSSSVVQWVMKAAIITITH